MKTLKKRRRIQVIIMAVVALTLATGLIGYGMRDGINFFRSPSAVAAEPPPPSEVFRIGGLVEEGSLIVGQGAVVHFAVTDGLVSIPVSFAGILPDLVIENQGVVANGSYIDGVFVANEVLARHDETYMPVEVADMFEDMEYYKAQQLEYDKAQDAYKHPGDS